MASSSTTMRAALLLFASFHASLSWDSSNIWFPDINNPVFYNMTFYNQAAKVIDKNPPPSENLIPVTESPRFNTNNHRQRTNPPVFNPLPEPPVTRPPVRPTETVRPNRNRFTTTTVKPNRNRTPTTTNGRMQGRGQSEFDRLAAEQELFIRNEQNGQVFRNSGQGSNVAAPQSGFNRLAQEQQTFIRNEQNNQRSRNPGEGIKPSPQSGNRRIQNQQQQHNMFVRNEQGINSPEVAVGYKTVPLEVTPSSEIEMFYKKNENSNQPLSGNRLRRTKNDGIADGGNYFNRNNGGGASDGQFGEERGRWSGERDAILRQNGAESYNYGGGSDRNVEMPQLRTFSPPQENRRQWNNGGTTGSDIATNVLSDLETSSKATGPSKCVWAIVSCCKPTSPQIRYNCFETLGCYGAFWDTNPCSKEMTYAAVQATAKFYRVPPQIED